jgi:hypothetical protein
MKKEIGYRVQIRLLAKVGKRVRVKGERANKNPFPFDLFPLTPLAKVTFARGLLFPVTCHLSPVTCHLSPVT